MKIRNGFVSNSSSSSFVLRIGAEYKNVFDVAKRMAKERDGWNAQWDREDGVDRKREDLVKKIVEAEKAGMDPNTPTMFKSCNYDTHLMRVETSHGACVVISTCNNVSWDLDADSGFVPADVIPVLRNMARIRLSSMDDRNRWYGDDPGSVSEWIQSYASHLTTFWDAENDKMVRQSANSW